MKRVLFFYSLLILSSSLFGQTKTVPSSSTIKKKISSVIKVDSAKTKPDSISSPKRTKLNHIADTLTLTDYMMSIERVNDALNSIRDSAELGFESVRLERKINDITEDLRLIRQNNRDRHSAVNIKNIYLYQSFATTLENDNSRIRTRVNLLYNRVYRAKLHLKTVLADSVFHALNSQKNIPDKLDKKLFRLERKWKRTDSIVKASIDSINVLKVYAANNSMNLSNMINRMDQKLDRAKPQLFGQEVSNLWQLRKIGAPASDTTKTLNILSTEHKAIGYYMSETTGKKEFMLFLGLLVFIWLYSKRKLLKVIQHDNTTYHYVHFHYLNNLPYVSLLVLLLCLMPLFDAYAPTSYIAIEYILLLASVSVIFSRKAKPSFLSDWYVFMLLFIADTSTYLLIGPTWIARMWMMAIHITIFVFSFRYYKKLSRQTPFYKLIRPAIVIGMILTALAVICNLFGRFSLSGILGLSGIFAITQVLFLPVFIDTVVEFILLQLLSSRLKKGIDRPFDTSIVTNKIKMPLILVSIVLWFIMLSSNLNIYDPISNALIDALTAPRNIGSISFKLISVLLFFVIIWLAHILQRLISFLFGETGNEIEDLTTITKGQHSRILITRLLVLIGGYLLAVAASGLPIDKLTFLLGALGIGIGMGLQGIVNNFVSGIILIFDGSLQIGDEIEVNGQSGKVKEIGLRASTLYTAEGAEVIIPNGSILSQNIVNWTFSNDQKRVTISFSLSGKELDANVVNEVINTTLEKIPSVILKRPPVILYTKVTSETLSLTVRFWSTIVNIDQVRSEAMLQLSAAFSAKGIGFE
jgi:potassium-dependent mechanosensitive channel